MKRSKHLVRRSAPRVIKGHVKKKNNWLADRKDYYWQAQEELVIDRKRPGEGNTHLLTVQDVRDFISLIPEWETRTAGLDAIVLCPPSSTLLGWYNESGVIHLCAWPRDLRVRWKRWFCLETVWLLSRLNVSAIELDDGHIEIEFTKESARAFQLIDVFLHELGHHHDRITTRRQWETARGEPYAVAFSLRLGEQMWDAYCQHFGTP